MPRDPDKYDFFVSYARADNSQGWITTFVEELLAEHQKFTGGREATYFFDKHDIRSFDDWQQSLSDGLQHSRLFLAFISPNYFASEWCRREWQTWIDLEIAKHILASGAAPIYFVEVPGFVGKVPGLAEQAMLTEQQVAAQVAELCQIPQPHDPFTGAVAPVVHQMRDRRQVTSDFVVPFHSQGVQALQQAELRRVLERLAEDLDQRAEYVRRAAESESTVPPYNKNFSGRLDELLDLRERLKDDRAGVISGVHGLGGVGKTELAFTYAHAFAGAYPGGRFHIECDGKTTLRDALLGTGSFTEFFRSQIDEESQKQPETYFAALVHCLRARLAERGHCLLVLDNVTDANFLSAQETDRLTSLGPLLHLLATTRLPAGSSKHIAWLTLGELPEADALALLEKHRPFDNGAEREAARKIVHRLGGFALAVELVATYLAAHSSASYAGLEAGLGLDDLDTIAEDSDSELRRHNQERRLGAVLGPLLESLSPAERLTIEYASILPPDHIALPWVRELVSNKWHTPPWYTRTLQFLTWGRRHRLPLFPELAHSGSRSDPWEEICQRMLRLALFNRAAGENNRPRIVRIHRLVQEVVRRALTARQLSLRQEALIAYIRVRDTALEETTRWEEARWELEPLEVLANLWADEALPEAPWLLSKCGERWYLLAAFARAERVLRRALLLDEAALGPQDTEVAYDLLLLAAVLRDTNRLEEAEILIRRALAIEEAASGPQDPLIVKHLSTLAQILARANYFAEAEALFRRALAIDEASWGPDDPAVAHDLNLLGGFLMDNDRLAEAEPLLRRVVTIHETNGGPEHTYLARGLNSLAQLLRKSNRLAESEPLVRRALAIDEAYYGADHPQVAHRLNNLAQLLQDTNQLSAAEPLLRRVLAIAEQTYVENNSEIATALNNLATLLLDSNRPAEAEPLIRRALAIDQACLEPGDPKLITDLGTLGQLLKRTGRFAEAEQTMRQALAISEQYLGQRDLKLAISLNNLAQLLAEMNHSVEAEALFRRSLNSMRQLLGDLHPLVAETCGNLGRLLLSTNRLPEAEPLLKHTLDVFLKFTQATGHIHAHLRNASGYYMTLLLKKGKSAEDANQELRALAQSYGVHWNDPPKPPESA